MSRALVDQARNLRNATVKVNKYLTAKKLYMFKFSYTASVLIINCLFFITSEAMWPALPKPNNGTWPTPQLLPPANRYNPPAVMKQITKWEDAQELAGQVIVYKTSSSYFDPTDMGLEYKHMAMQFGYIGDKIQQWNLGHNQSEQGYQLHRFVGLKEASTTKALINHYLQSSNEVLLMRKANENEIDEIIRERANFRYFENMTSERVQEIIQKMKKS